MTYWETIGVIFATLTAFAVMGAIEFALIMLWSRGHRVISGTIGGAIILAAIFGLPLLAGASS